MTQADEALIAFAASKGHTVTPRQLKRWRSEGLLPERRRRGLGRGRGSEATDPQQSRDQLLAVIDALTRHRSADQASLELWFDGWDIATSRARALIDRQIEVERRHHARLEQQAGPSADGFDLAEIDSRTTPVTRAELNRMRMLASSEDTPHQLVHAVRSALTAQVLGGEGNDVAIDDEQMEAYLELEKLAPLFEVLGVELPTAELAAALPRMDPLASPSDEQLEEARRLLQRIRESRGRLREMSDPTVPPELPGLFADMLERQLSGYAPSDTNYTPKKLIDALRSVAATRPEHIEFMA